MILLILINIRPIGVGATFTTGIACILIIVQSLLDRDPSKPAAHMCNISKHNNIIQYVNIENMGDREGIYFRQIHYIQYTFNI
jgi:hypothetical protein